MKTFEEITRAAETVRVTVGLAGRSVRVEALHEGKWWLLYGATMKDGGAGALLAFDGGVRVEVGGIAASDERAKRDHTLGMLEGERQIEALRARARCVDPPTSDGAREEPATSAVRVGDVVRVRGIQGPAWVVENIDSTPGYPDRAQCLRFDGGTAMAGASIRDAFPVAVLEPTDIDVTKPIQGAPPIQYVLKVDGLATSEAISAAFERAMGVRLPPESEEDPIIGAAP